MGGRIATTLSEPGRLWTPNPPADEAAIARLCASAPFEFPAEYLELLRFCNGGYGEIEAPPLLFWLDPIERAVERNELCHNDGAFAAFWLFGHNGGLEAIAFDLRERSPLPIVMIDCIAGEGSAKRIADTMADFVAKIGLPAPDA